MHFLAHIKTAQVYSPSASVSCCSVHHCWMPSFLLRHHLWLQPGSKLGLLDPVCHLLSAHRLCSLSFFSALPQFEPSTRIYVSLGPQYNFFVSLTFSWAFLVLIHGALLFSNKIHVQPVRLLYLPTTSPPKAQSDYVTSDLP